MLTLVKVMIYTYHYTKCQIITDIIEHSIETPIGFKDLADSNFSPLSNVALLNSAKIANATLIIAVETIIIKTTILDMYSALYMSPSVDERSISKICGANLFSSIGISKDMIVTGVH